MILTVDKLKDPLLVFSCLKNYDLKLGENFIEANSHIVAPLPFIIWLRGRHFISGTEADRLMFEIDETIEIFAGYKSSLFPCVELENTCALNKSYTLLAEYISNFKVFRERLYEILDNRDLLEVDDSFMKCKMKLTDDYVKTSNLYYSDRYTFADIYNYFVTKRINDCNF